MYSKRNYYFSNIQQAEPGYKTCVSVDDLFRVIALQNYRKSTKEMD